MSAGADLLQRHVGVWNDRLYWAAAEKLPSALVPWSMLPVTLAELAVFLVALVLVAEMLDRWWERGAARGLVVACHAVAALYALRLLWWIYIHPSETPTGVTSRWDFLAMAALGGVALRRFPAEWRAWALAGPSFVLLEQYFGPLPIRGTTFALLLGFAATRWRVTDAPRMRVVVHAVLLSLVVGWLWLVRVPAHVSALQGWGLFGFAMFRHVSFVTEHARGYPSTLGGYLCYMFFFPNCVGATEVYDEFWSRNLERVAAPQRRRAARMIVAGNLWLAIALSIPVDMDRLVAAVGFIAMWSTSLLLFLRAALAVTGAWAIIEGGALFLGVELRANFQGVLTATSPSQFWRACRGTMTNWLIRYVYIPLGGNRRHQIANIVITFFVSTVWHCMGVPFLHPKTWGAESLLPVVAWGC